jgi:hypothetical protein
MKKTLLSLLILFFAVTCSFAQDNSTKVGVGFDLGIPVGAASNDYEVTGGVTAKLEIPLTTPVSFTVTTGFMGYVTKGGFYTEYNSYYGSSTSGAVACFVPLEAGIKTYVSPRIFVEGDLGLSFNINSDYTEFTGKKTAFIYAPMAGVTIPFGSTRASLDLGLRYESRMETGYSFDQVAVRALFNFGLSK